MQVVVTEKDETNPRSASTEVTVRIMDTNDNSPQFPPQGYTADIMESELTARRPVLKVSRSGKAVQCQKISPIFRRYRPNYFCSDI